MTNNNSAFATIYRLLLRLYPQSFREEFGPEMESVFEEQWADLASRGRIVQMQFFLRELFDWPLQCFHAHWQVRQTRPRVLTGAPLSSWDTAASSLPFLLFALFITSNLLIYLFGIPAGLFTLLLFGYGFVFIFLVVLLIAWWRGWPAWSITWLGFLLITLLAIVLPVLFGEIFSVSPQLQPAGVVLNEIAFPLLLLITFYVLLTRWPRAGLAAMLPALGLPWLLYLEFVPESTSTAILAATWIWLGLVAIVLLRWRRFAWDVWLLYLAAVAVGVMYISSGHFLTEVPVRDGTFFRMVEDLLTNLLPALIPLVAILILHSLRLWAWRAGGSAVTSYRLVFAGFFLTLVGVQVNLRIIGQGDLLSWRQGIGAWFSAAPAIGLLFLVIGIRGMVNVRLRERSLFGRVTWLLLGLLLVSPLMFDISRLPVIYGGVVYQQLGAEQFAQGNFEARVLQMQWLSYLAGVSWLLLAGWAIGRVRPHFTDDSVEPLPESAPVGPAQEAVPNAPNRGANMTFRENLYLFAGLVFLAGLLVPLSTLAILFPNNGAQPFDLGTAFPLFMVMTAALILAAVLLSSGINLYYAGSTLTGSTFFALSILLLMKALHSFYWLMVWDSTYDGLGVFWLFIPITGVLLGVGWLAFSLPKKARLGTLLYLILVPPLLVLVFGAAQQVDFRRLTELRAERVNDALERYYIEQGSYPDTLNSVSPRYLLSTSEPVIIFGQDWCYEGGGEIYQLGYVDREHWSDPRLKGRVYSSTGQNLSALSHFCEAKITALEARDPGYYKYKNEYGKLDKLGDYPQGGSIDNIE